MNGKRPPICFLEIKTSLQWVIELLTTVGTT